MLEVSHYYTKRYGSTIACDDITFILPDSSVIVFLGPNGADESTLLKAIHDYCYSSRKIAPEYRQYALGKCIETFLMEMNRTEEDGE